MKEWLREKIACAHWSVLPDPLWFLVASPLLWWAFGARKDMPILNWPNHDYE